MYIVASVVALLTLVMAAEDIKEAEAIPVKKPLNLTIIDPLVDFEIIGIGEVRDVSLDLFTVVPIYIPDIDLKPSKPYQIVASFNGPEGFEA